MKAFVIGLTMFRLISAPVIFFLLIFSGLYWAAFWLYNIAAISDFFDGKLARDFGVESATGEILDPIADKLLVLFSFLSIILLTQNSFITLIIAFILAREFWVSALRDINSRKGIEHVTKVTIIAKTKTALQMVAISMFLFGAASEIALVNFLAIFVLFLSLLFAYKSAIDYSQKSINASHSNKNF